MLIEIGPDDQSITDRGNVVAPVSLQFYRSRVQCFGGSGALFLPLFYSSSQRVASHSCKTSVARAATRPDKFDSL